MAEDEITALIVEDEPTLRQLFVRYLGIKNVKTDAVETTREGLELLEERTYNFVMTDLNQQPTGVEVYKAAISKGMAAYIMTGGGSSDLLAEAEKEAGPNLIYKPFPMSTIDTIIEQST